MNAIQELTQQRLLLQIEYNCERENFRRQTETFGIGRLAKRGDAWFPVKAGKSYFNSLNQLVIEIFRTEDSEIEHNFEYGRPVQFFTIGEKDGKPHVEYKKYAGTISYVDGERMVVVVPDNAPVAELQHGENIGVQLSFDETSYRLMFEALDRVIKGKGNRLTYLRDLFYGNQKAETFSFPPIRFPWLNAAQERAVNLVLRSKDVAIVHGPPGTGKTTTLVEAIYETLRRENQVLVCAQSNMAVDWISERLVDRGINVLRIGNPTKVNDKMLSFTYERRFEAHPDYPQLWSIREAIRKLRSGSKRRDDSYHQKLERLKARATDIEFRINAQLFGEARVIASTLTGSANRLLSGQKFGTLFIDEAAQALEAACWIAIRKASRVVLAGDHCQLPPTVKSIAALKGGLGVTLMERIVENKPEVVQLLKVQYRMNEEIMRFSSDWFYNGEVEAAPEVKFRGILDYDTPMTWVDTTPQAPHMGGCSSPQGAKLATETLNGNEVNGQLESHTSSQSDEPKPPIWGVGGSEKFVGSTFGRINKVEAEQTLEVLQSYLSRISKERILDERIDIGIISPYRAQVQYLRKLIRKQEFFKPFRHLISVNTVDGFQGQERDVIIISLVRSNEKGEIGFLGDLRRMNVAITRARMKLIIMGDVSTMTKHPFYKRLYDYCQSVNG